jgi:alpha-beta hydrolase superfamily lysophospholipase
MFDRVHSIRVLALISALGASTLGAQPTFVGGTRTPSTFKIFIRSTQVGTEDIVVRRAADGWTISGSGRLGDLVSRRLEIEYDSDWKPRALALDAAAGGQQLVLRIAVEGTTAQSERWEGSRRNASSDTIDPHAVFLPNPFFGAYAALSARLRTATPGTRLAVYQGLGATFEATVGESSVERLQTVERLIEARRTRITFALPDGPPLDAEIWGDEEGRLLKLSVPTQFVDVVRDDLSAVSTRRVLVSRAGDQQVRVPANGFSLAATLSAPAGSPATPFGAVILVGGSGQVDRDEAVAGMPIFGQLAGTLADAGFVVLRYDKRGVGQSGGRPESATLADYAEDLRAAVRFMSERKDVDRRRLAVVGHSEGGSVGMLAAARDKRIAALALVATIGVTGAELNLAQVSHAMSRSARSDADKQATIELQKRIQTAVITGLGWETVPANLRRQADGPWFHSFLSFDPAKPMAAIRQPILVVQGLLDTEVAPSNADRLEALARARKHKSGVAVVRIPGVNHVLVPATTGEVDEYASLSNTSVSPDVSRAITQWLNAVFRASPK